jgi:hypothetical protein
MNKIYLALSLAGLLVSVQAYAVDKPQDVAPATAQPISAQDLKEIQEDIDDKTGDPTAAASIALDKEVILECGKNPSSKKCFDLYDKAAAVHNAHVAKSGKGQTENRSTVVTNTIIAPGKPYAVKPGKVLAPKKGTYKSGKGGSGGGSYSESYEESYEETIDNGEEIDEDSVDEDSMDEDTSEDTDEDAADDGGDDEADDEGDDGGDDEGDDGGDDGGE